MATWKVNPSDRRHRGRSKAVHTALLLSARDERLAEIMTRVELFDLDRIERLFDVISTMQCEPGALDASTHRFEPCPSLYR